MTENFNRPVPAEEPSPESSDLYVSFFKNYCDKFPQEISIAKLYELIVSGQLGEITEKYRYFRSQHFDKDAEEAKKKSCGVVPSAICRGGRTKKHAVRYTGIGMADFDDIPFKAIEKCMRKLKKNPYVYLAYITVSRIGIRIFYRTGIKDPRFHKYVFNQGNEYFSKLLGFPHDLQCHDLTRFSFICDCPEAIFHPEALILPIDLSEEENKKPEGKKLAGRPCKIYHVSVSQIEKFLLKRLAQEGKTYAEGHYNEYVSAAFYLLNRFGAELEDALQWALNKFPDYEPVQVESIARSVYQHTEEHGKERVKESDLHTVLIERLEAFVESQAKIRYNEILGRREICLNSEKTFRDLTDTDENSLWLRAEKSGLACGHAKFLCLLNSEFIPSYNPLTDYVSRNRAWDGTTDYIARVAAMVHTTDPEMFPVHFRKWFVGMIASLLDSSIVNHTILVLLGRQGIYKTTFFNRLLPPELQRYFYTKTNGPYVSKDDMLTLSEFALICIEEIDSMRPSELNRLKAMVTMVHTDERPAFTRNKVHRPHIASFCATGNNKQFLIDDSGNRRWLPYWVKSIDSPYATVFPYEGLYAQGVALYKAGFPYWFSDEEMAVLQSHNADFEEPNIEEELICSRFRKPVQGEAGFFISIAEIMEYIGSIIKYPLSKTKISHAMDKLGFERARTEFSRGFRVFRLTPEETAGRKIVNSDRTSADGNS